MMKQRVPAQYVIGQHLARVWTAVWMALFAYLFLDVVHAVPVDLTMKSAGYFALMVIPALPIGYILGAIVSYTVYKIGSLVLGWIR